MVLRGTPLGVYLHYQGISGQPDILYGFVLVPIALVCLMQSGLFLRSPIPTWKFVLICAVLAYNAAMFSCHFLWLHNLEVYAMYPATKRVVEASATQAFRHLEDEVSARSRECCICLEEFDGPDLVMLLPCGHVLHQGCGSTWLQRGHTCPYRCMPPASS